MNLMKCPSAYKLGWKFTGVLVNKTIKSNLFQVYRSCGLLHTVKRLAGRMFILIACHNVESADLATSRINLSIKATLIYVLGQCGGLCRWWMKKR